MRICLSATGMNKKLSFFTSAFYYTFGVILAQGFTFLLTVVVFGRMISTVDYAYISLYSMWASVFGSLVGLEAASSLNNARIHYGTQELGKYSSSLLGVGLLTLALFTGVLFCFPAFFSQALDFSPTILFFCLLQGFFAFCIMVIAQKCRVTNKPLQFVFWSSLMCMVRFVLSIIFINQMTENRYLGDIFGSLFAYAGVGVAAIILLLRDSKIMGNKAYWKFCLTLTVPIVFHTLSNLILGQADRYMLDKMTDKEQVGIYSFVYNIGLIANALWLAFNNAWTVWYFDKTKEKKTEEILVLYKKYTAFVGLFMLALLLVSPDVVSLFGGEKYAAGRTLIPLIMAGCFFMFLYTFPIGYETYKNRTIYIAVGTVSAAGVNILLNFLWIPAYGMTGAAVATLLSYVVLFAFHYLIARFLIRGFQIPFLYLLVPALILCGVMGLTYAAMDVIWLRWALGIAMLAGAVLVWRRGKGIMM